MKVIVEIDEARFKDIQRIAEVQLEMSHFQTAEQIIAKGTPLEQEPCEDVCEWFEQYVDIATDIVEFRFSDGTVKRAKRGLYMRDIEKSIRKMLTDQMANGKKQEPKTGRWIPTGYDGYADGNPVYDWWECSECGWEHTGDEETLTPYCPNCGAKMVEPQESEEV